MVLFLKIIPSVKHFMNNNNSMGVSMYGRDKVGKGKAFAYLHDTTFCHSNSLNNVSSLYLSLKEKSIKLQGEGGCEGEFMKYMSYVMFIQADGGFYQNNRI